jgi:hypothetical protein
MKSKSSGFMGMTGTQISILIGLAVVALLSICGVGWAMLSLGSLGAAPAATTVVSMPSPTVTATEDVTATPEITATPTPPSTVAPPDGWVEFTTQGGGLWLPNSFVGGDMIAHKNEVISKVRQLGSFFRPIADSMKQPPTNTVLWMVDKNKQKNPLVTTVIVRSITLTDDTTIDKVIADYLANSNPPPTVNETKKLTILGREARRLISQGITNTLDFSEFDYIIKDENDFWIISYVMSTDIYMDSLPMVEKSIQTFNISK